MCKNLYVKLSKKISKVHLRSYKNTKLKLYAFPLNLLLTLSLLLCPYTALEAQTCSAITNGIFNLTEVKKGQCYEISGNNIIDKDLKISGTLILKAGHNAKLTKRATLTVHSRGSFIVRGNLLATDTSKILVKDRSLLQSTGAITLNHKSTLSLEDNARFDDKGILELQSQSTAQILDRANLNNSSRFNMTDSLLYIKGGSFLNRGTVGLNRSTLNLDTDAKFENKGKFVLDRNSSAAALHNAQFKNNKNIEVGGVLYFRDYSRAENKSSLKVAISGSLILNSQEAFYNRHNIENKGNMILKKATLINTGTINHKRGANLELMVSAYIKNNGSLRIDGPYTVDKSSSIENNNVLFVNKKATPRK